MATQQRRSLETELRAAVASQVGESRFALWFGEGVRLGVDGDSLVVRVPNGFFREWIQGHFASPLAAAGESVTGRALRLDVRVDDVSAEADPPLGDVVVRPVGPEPEPRRTGPTVPIPGVAPPTTPVAPLPVAPPFRERGAAAEAGWRPGARPLRRLDDFVVGPSNRLAHAAALDLVQSAGASFNPLVLHGGIGLGKTHLLEGVVQGLKSRYPGWNILQTTAEGFTNSFLDAMRSSGLGAFRARVRKADALIVDDVHFLAAKRATQDEFLHTFNAVMAAGSPIVLAADQHPRQIARLPEELVTRFLGGMVVRLDAPEPATRRAILRAKAAARGIDVPPPVLDYIAEHLRSSVRELEGALHSVIAQALLTGRRIDLELAKGALRDTIRHTAQAIALKDIERSVCELFGIDGETLRSESRAKKAAQPRMVAMYLARRHTSASYSEIGRFFGGRNHSTVISAEKKVAHWLAQESRGGLLAGFESIADLMLALEQGFNGR